MISPRSLVRMAPPRAVRGICTTAPPSKPPPEPLSPSELDAVSALLPRLLSADHVPAAGRLLSAALLLPGSLERLPLPSLAAHLASLPTLSPAFALLTALRHHPARPPSPLPLAAPMLDSLLSLRRARDAASVLRWLCRQDSPRRPDAAAVAGFCRLEDAKSALAALREMSADGVQASRLLREAVRDAMLGSRRRGRWRRRCSGRKPGMLWSWPTGFFWSGSLETLELETKNNAWCLCAGCECDNFSEDGNPMFCFRLNVSEKVRTRN
jgi:hypothetical protein